MKVELLVSEWCPTCPQAERIWSEVAAERDFDFSVLDLNQTEGRELAHRLRVRTIPALVIDGELKAVGVLSLAEARALTVAAPPRRASPRHAGMMLSTDNRWFVSTAMIYLVASGMWFAWHGAMIADGSNRGIGLHLFGAGFVQSLIYGLGGHMLPRFTGNPIRAGGFAWVQYGCINTGIALFMGSHWLESRWMLILGGLLMWLSLLMFALRLWPVLWRQHANGNGDSR